MNVWAGLLLLIATVVLMEGVAYGAHRWIMHGPGWILHKSHHRPRDGRFEANDLYGIIFAVPSVALIFFGLHGGTGEWAVWVGCGVAVYGAIYAIFHDVIVHRRVSHRYVPRGRYMKRITQAHRLHHAVETKGGAVSFGFLIAPRPEVLKARLQARDRAGVRAPAARP